MKARLTARALGHKLRLHQLQILDRILERGSLSAAARDLNLTQPAVTRAVRELEQFVGAPLFERSNRGVVPTPLALVIGRRARQMLADMRLLADDVNAVLEGSLGHLVIGTLISASARLLPEALSRLLAQSPNVQIRLVEGPSRELFPALAAGEIDLVVGRLPGPERSSAAEASAPMALSPDVVHHALYQERLCLLAGSQHPLHQASEVTLHDLHDDLWIVPTTASPLRDVVEQTFRDAGLSLPTRHIESLSFQTNIGLLLRTPAVALMPYDAARTWLELGLLYQLPLHELRHFGTVGYSLGKRGPLSGACVRLISCLEHVAREMQMGADKTLGQLPTDASAKQRGGNPV